MIMHTVSQVSSGLALLVAASSLAVAGHVPIQHKRAGEAHPLLGKRQAAQSCADALCVSSEILAAVPSSLLPKTTAPPATTDTPLDSPTTTTGRSPNTTTGASSGDDGGHGGHIIVSVAQPSLCSESVLQFSSSYSVPTGSIQIATGGSWGVEGSVWNITANDGVHLNDFRVPCQGSGCTGIRGNPEEDGKIVKNADEPSVAIFGNASGGQPVDGKYDLTVTSTPPCALPVFQNCSGRNFDPTADQWEAYSTSDFLTRYLADNEITSLSRLLSKASTDFLPKTDAQSLICTPGAGDIYDCDYPSYTQCDSSSPDATAGFLVVAAVVRMSQLLTLLYNSIQAVQGDMVGYITQIVVKFFQPQAEQKWQSIVTAVSSIVGLFTFVAILIDAFTAGAATSVLVAAVVGVQTVLAASATFANGFNAEKPDATYLAIDGNYTQGVMEYARGLEEIVDGIWDNTDLGSSGIADALASGAWLDVPNPYNVTGIAEEARDWLDNLLVTSYINRVFNDADTFIVFLPYAKYVYTLGISGRDTEYDFTQEDCQSHWHNDPGWPYYSTCDVPLGDKPGMAVVTRPSTEGKGSKDWTSKVEWHWGDYTWESHDMVVSAVAAFAEHGFGYDLHNVDYSNILNKGSQEALDTWKTLPLTTLGLFNIPVCIISDIKDVPGGVQIAKD
ncbi:MAG: hypothetical protein Q9184_008044, partial [Pyrenodesmia sp. 2 TL-2023]